MDKSKAIELLKEALTEISHLKELHHDNREFRSWDDKVLDIIKAGLDANDVERFLSRRTMHVVSNQTPDDVYQKYYLEDLENCEAGLKSIIQKYEILGFETKPSAMVEPTPKAFISHGKENIALSKVEEFLSALGIEPIRVEKQPSLDKTLDDKVSYYLNQADFVIILATGDDMTGGRRQPRQNVIHEVGLAQKTHAGKIIYLLEEGVEFPSNIRPKVWERFNQDNMQNVFGYIARELRAFGVLRVIRATRGE